MILQEPIKRGNFEVVSIQEAMRKLSIIIHTYGLTQDYIASTEGQMVIASKAKHIIKFLEDEGFIAPGQFWLSNVGTISHPAKTE